MTKHTPGPWVRDFKPGYQCDVRAASGRKVAVTGGLQDPKTREAYIVNSSENDANAHLIAAAPEMYDMLTTAVRYFRHNNIDCQSLHVGEMEQVLKKARGES